MKGANKADKNWQQPSHNTATGLATFRDPTNSITSEPVKLLRLVINPSRLVMLNSAFQPLQKQVVC